MLYVCWCIYVYLHFFLLYFLLFFSFRLENVVSNNAVKVEMAKVSPSPDIPANIYLREEDDGETSPPTVSEPQTVETTLDDNFKLVSYEK